MIILFMRKPLSSSLNRTIQELKLKKNLDTLSILNPLNRTIQELKYIAQIGQFSVNGTLNRTIQELK